MMNNRIFFCLSSLFLLLLFATCEKEVPSFSRNVEVEQLTPESMNGFFKLRASIKNLNISNKNKCIAGFVVEKVESGNSYIERHMESVYECYKYMKNGEYYHSSGTNYFWIENVDTNGNFEVEFTPSNCQYVCKAFVLNLLTENLNVDNSGPDFQLIESEPCFFSGGNAIDVTIHMANVLTNEFVVKTGLSEDSYGTKGICWSATNEMPTIEDFVSETSYDADTLRLSLGTMEENVIYLRAFNKQAINGSSTSYKIIYSDVLKFDRTEPVIKINTKEDLDKFLNIFKEKASWHYNGYRGKIIFNYPPTKNDWSESEVLLEPINCSLICDASTRGYIRTDRIGEHGYIKGFSLYSSSIFWTNNIVNYGSLEDVKINEGFTNYGKIKSCTNLNIYTNSGDLTDCVNVIVEQNYGLMQNCSNTVSSYNNSLLNLHHLYGQVMVRENKSSGKIINCTGDMSYVCRTNEGYMKDCYPESTCCSSNQGIIEYSNKQ